MGNPLMVAGNKLAAGNKQEYERCRRSLKRALARVAEDHGHGLDLISDRLVRAALDSQPWAIQMIYDRLDGKAKEHIHIEHTQSYGSLESIQAEIAKAIEERAQQLLEARSVVAVQHKPEEPTDAGS